MLNTFRKNAQLTGSKGRQIAIVCSLLLMATGCGKDSDDGEVRNAVALPTDFVLNLYCVDIGINDNTCVLDDPDNPYARTPFTTGNADPDAEEGEDFNAAKFALYEAAPSSKARFYVMATALARAPNGENQWYTARALHELYTDSGSDLIKGHTIRAYRSVLDNFFDSATFFVANFLPSPPPGGITYPIKLRERTAADLALTPGAPCGLNPAACTPLFDPADADNNQFAARETMGGWGYTWNGLAAGPPGGAPTVIGPVTKN